MTESALLAMLANKLEGLLCISDATISNAAESFVSTINEDSNASEIRAVSSISTIKGPYAECLLPWVGDMQEALGSSHDNRASAVMLLRVLSSSGTLEQAWAFSLESSLGAPAIPKKSKHSRLDARGDKTTHGSQVSVYTTCGNARGVAEAIRNIMPPCCFMPNTFYRTGGTISFEEF